MAGHVKKEVTLRRITKAQARQAQKDLTVLFRLYGVTGQDQDIFWNAFAAFTTYLLLKNGELPGTDLPGGDGQDDH